MVMRRHHELDDPERAAIVQFIQGAARKCFLATSQTMLAVTGSCSAGKIAHRAP